MTSKEKRFIETFIATDRTYLPNPIIESSFPDLNKKERAAWCEGLRWGFELGLEYQKRDNDVHKRTSETGNPEQ